MYLRKIDGPRSVKLPDGTMMTRADLPVPETRRWVASRKATVVKAVAYGLVAREEARECTGCPMMSWASGKPPCVITGKSL